MGEATMTLSPGASHILNTAEQLFARHGYDGVSMQQIATAAAISKANIYHHFQSKEKLYLALLKQGLEDMKQLLDSLQEIEGSARTRLAHFSAEHLNHIRANSSISKLILRELLDGDSSRGEMLAKQLFEEYFSTLRAALAQCQESNEIRDDIDPDHMAAALVGMNVFLFQAWPALKHLPGHLFSDHQESGMVMFELLFNGFARRGANHA